jgi:hypothetical protein
MLSDGLNRIKSGKTKELSINFKNMTYYYKIIKTTTVSLFLLVFSYIAGHSQQGLTLEQSLITAETNSPTMKKTRLNLIRSQENLNAQNAALKSNFSLTLRTGNSMILFQTGIPEPPQRAMATSRFPSLLYLPMPESHLQTGSDTMILTASMPDQLQKDSAIIFQSVWISQFSPTTVPNSHSRNFS